MPQNVMPWNNPKALREASQVNDAYHTDSGTTSHVLTAANLTGAAVGVVLAMTGTLAAGATGTTDTAANIIAAVPNRYPGQTYRLRIINESSGAFSWTIAGGTGVTVTGTATVAQNAWREFLVTLGATLTTVTLQSVGTGTNS